MCIRSSVHLSTSHRIAQWHRDSHVLKNYDPWRYASAQGFVNRRGGRRGLGTVVSRIVLKFVAFLVRQSTEVKEGGNLLCAGHVPAKRVAGENRLASGATTNTNASTEHAEHDHYDHARRLPVHAGRSRRHHHQLLSTVPYQRASLSPVHTAAAPASFSPHTCYSSIYPGMVWWQRSLVEFDLCLNLSRRAPRREENSKRKDVECGTRMRKTRATRKSLRRRDGGRVVDSEDTRRTGGGGATAKTERADSELVRLDWRGEDVKLATEGSNMSAVFTVPSRAARGAGERIIAVSAMDTFWLPRLAPKLRIWIIDFAASASAAGRTTRTLRFLWSHTNLSGGTSIVFKPLGFILRSLGFLAVHHCFGTLLESIPTILKTGLSVQVFLSDPALTLTCRSRTYLPRSLSRSPQRRRH
ncbi:hypothetical protein B0H16DRAFT_1693075 [Mycena metata]|uniref:Uncharacterized protein n=1 Tax=Mycena metata TaxID=1033252 RepID=A0AAD7IM59_9AGAR|nr:hypothetical protein B0H16DRAFT_1693075 [Mycena metata]